MKNEAINELKKEAVAYTDLLYFGYEYENDSKKFQSEFMQEAKEKFETIEFRNAYDSIKGYRQEVYLEDSNRENFFAWVIAHGWIDMSLTMQLVMMQPEEKPTFMKYFDLAKQQYPHCFKS
jgi:hypothetical protein